jgi:hypothetical protein
MLCKGQDFIDLPKTFCIKWRGIGGMNPLRRLILLLVACSAFAATPVASVMSSSDFQLRGVSVNTAGVSSWPILAGDTVTAGTGPATMRFMDGTMVTLGPSSRVKVQRKKDDLSLQLLNGSMSFVLAPSSALQVYSGDTLLSAQPGVTTSATAPRTTTQAGSLDLVKTPPPSTPAPAPISRQ